MLRFISSELWSNYNQFNLWSEQEARRPNKPHWPEVSPWSLCPRTRSRAPSERCLPISKTNFVEMSNQCRYLLKESITSHNTALRTWWIHQRLLIRHIITLSIIFTATTNFSLANRPNTIKSHLPANSPLHWTIAKSSDH